MSAEVEVVKCPNPKCGRESDSAAGITVTLVVCPNGDTFCMSCFNMNNADSNGYTVLCPCCSAVVKLNVP